jgi:hypothetical protein
MGSPGGVFNFSGSASIKSTILASSMAAPPLLASPAQIAVERSQMLGSTSPMTLVVDSPRPAPRITAMV